MRIYRFTVRGSGNFPFPMLHLCEAWPATRNDAETMVYACPINAVEQTITFATRKYLLGAERDLWRLEKWPILHMD
jgi:hypothetical protein